MPVHADNAARVAPPLFQPAPPPDDNAVRGSMRAVTDRMYRAEDLRPDAALKALTALPSRTHRAVATVVLGSAGVFNIEHALALFTDAYQGVRQSKHVQATAWWLLGTVMEKNPHLIASGSFFALSLPQRWHQAISPQTESDPYIRAMAVRAWGVSLLNGQQAVSHVTRALSDANPLVQYFAAQAFNYLPHDQIVDSTLEGLLVSTQDDAVRRAAAQALTHSELGIQILMHELDHHRHAVSRAAVQALGEAGALARTQIEKLRRLGMSGSAIGDAADQIEAASRRLPFSFQNLSVSQILKMHADNLALAVTHASAGLNHVAPQDFHLATAGDRLSAIWLSGMKSNLEAVVGSLTIDLMHNLAHMAQALAEGQAIDKSKAFSLSSAFHYNLLRISLGHTLQVAIPALQPVVAVALSWLQVDLAGDSFQRAAVAFLRHAGPLFPDHADAVGTALAKLLESNAATDIRRDAILGLERLMPIWEAQDLSNATPRAGAASRIQRAMQDHDPDIQRAAFRTLVHTGAAPVALRQLAFHLNSGDAATQQDAVAVLQELRYYGGTQVLMEYLRTANLADAHRVLGGLSIPASEGIAPTLNEMLKRAALPAWERALTRGR